MADGMGPEQTPQPTNRQVPAQRKTTLKWDANGELTAVDMARIIDRLTHPDLNRCDLESA
ncbi:hypothetical protein [Synechococcus sp. MIT S1220]|uniref:hypothetical protein n=1 Tax=Synechococcus sp. MIT S1220 TaxID=3082549 RepID=UPI0039B0A568